MNVEQIAKQLAATWGTKTLAEFRDEAAKEMNGTLFETLKAGDQRLIIAACFTGEHEIGILSRTFDFSQRGKPADWSTEVLGDVVMRTATGSGFSYEAERDTATRFKSVLLIAADPRSIRILETVLGL